MNTNQLKTLGWIHKWTSLVCTLFLIMLCLTGLPLIFHDEIESVLNPEEWTPDFSDGRMLSYDELLQISLQKRLGEVPIYLSFDIERPVVNVTTGPQASAGSKEMYFASYDQTSGAVVPPQNVGESVMEFILQLHTDMFLGLPGMLFLSLIGAIFLIATISGIVLYKHFMRSLPFGTVRHEKNIRVKFLDYHNLFGICTAAWVLVVSLTGTINALEKPIISKWQNEHLKSFIRQNESDTTAVLNASIDMAIKSAQELVPGMTLQFIAFPGSRYSTNRHYAIYFHGDTPLTREIIKPVLVDAESGVVSGVADLPWYVTTLSLSRPLHFGDYGGISLKIVWAILTLSTLMILFTGLYLWWRKSLN